MADEVDSALYHLARHAGGLGGLATLDALEPERVEALLERLIADLDREARAWKVK